MAWVNAHPTMMDEKVSLVVLSRTTLREKRAYWHGGAFRLFWYDEWAAKEPFTACSSLSVSDVVTLESFRLTLQALQ